MIAALLLMATAPAAPMTAIDAERAFAADAQKQGQWTAFRKYAAPDALMFTPQPVNAQQFLKDKKNPPVSVYWWPGRSYVSCDGKVAVNTGPWVRGYGKLVGYFTTVWVRQNDGSWKWIYDGGDALDTPRAEGGDVAPVVATCGKPEFPSVRINAAPPSKQGFGQSPDGTLDWEWTVRQDGSRLLIVHQWNGQSMTAVLVDRIGADKL